MSVLSFVAAAAIVGMIYGLSFLPNATLAEPDDTFGVVEDGASDETEAGRKEAHA